MQGDIVAVYNASGTKLVSYTYDAWGNQSVTYSNGGASTAAQYNPFRYRGYYYDTETGWYYLQSRYYNPTWGRFINADGYINANGDIIGFNMFAYCSNNPVIYVDFTGRGLMYDSEEPDWASSYTSKQLRMLNEIGINEFLSYPEYIQDQLLFFAQYGMYMSGFTSADLTSYYVSCSNDIKTRTRYADSKAQIYYENEIISSPIIHMIPIYGPVCKLFTGLKEPFGTVQNIESIIDMIKDPSLITEYGKNELIELFKLYMNAIQDAIPY